MKKREVLPQKSFYQLCEWLKSLPQPITATKVVLAEQATAFLKTRVRAQNVASAIEASDVAYTPIMRLRRDSGNGSPSKGRIRSATICNLISRVVSDIEATFGQAIITESTRADLAAYSGQPQELPEEQG